MSRIEQLISEIEEYIDSCKSQALSKSKIIVNKEQTTEMINEHEIMQRAYSHAEEVISQANIQAQAIVDAAVNDANNIRQGSIQYTDDMLRSLQTILNHTMDNAKGRFDAFMSSMQSSYDIVSANRNELSGGIVKEENAEAAAAVENQETQAD